MDLESASTVQTSAVRGSQICEHGRQRSASARSVVVQGVRWVSNLRARSSALSVWWCKECGGSASKSASTVVGALGARSAAGAQICEHGRQRSKCKECKECGGSQICEHGRERSQCKECGSQICEHGRRRRSKCCINLRARSSRSARSAGVSNLRARSSALSVQGVRWGLKSASTVVGALCARSAVVVESASTVVSAIGARTVEANGCNQTPSHDYHIHC